MSTSSASDVEVLLTSTAPARPLARGRRRGTGSGVPIRVVGLVAAGMVLVAALGAALALGLRGFDVETPSMGRAAPVGTLVVTRPVAAGDLRVGDVVTFHPDASDTTYTHRITAVTSSGISTRGDANGADDAWVLDPADVVGRAVAVLPGVGWALRGTPWIVASIAMVWFASGFVRSAEARTALRLLGTSLSVAVVAAVLRPFVAVQVLEASRGADGGAARVVSTGVLPIRASVADGGSAHLDSGASAVLALPSGPGGVLHVAARLDPSPTGWVLLAAACAVPVVVAVLASRRSVGS